MPIHSRAGKPAKSNDLCNIPRLVCAYYEQQPDISEVSQQVNFGTSGHRGSALNSSFNQAHIFAITQALIEYRKKVATTGPIFIGKDTHALSEPAFYSVLQVLIANEIKVYFQADFGYTPTPVISHAVLAYNRQNSSELADGIIITPSHNPPEDGGIKYNPPHGGPADTDATDWIQHRANDLINNNLSEVRTVSLNEALASSLAIKHDYIHPYVNDLDSIVDMAAIRESKIRIGVDPMGGSGIDYWPVIAERYNLDITVVNTRVDPSFEFMTLDKDGKIRMDCSSSYAMANLIKLKNDYDISVSNDPDNDRHGIVTPSSGLMNPNHFLAVSINYLLQHRPHWNKTVKIGKTLVSSSMIDRVVAASKRTLCEVPVGFKWFVDGLHTGNLAFGGEESAGASFLRKDGSVWSTDKDVIIMALLAAEIIAVTKRDPSQAYQSLEATHGSPVYERIDAPATLKQKAILKALDPSIITTNTLAGEPILAKLTRAPGNDSSIGGLKVVTENGWFAARPSGTEDIYKIYAESFLGMEHLMRIKDDARMIVNAAFEAAGTD